MRDIFGAGDVSREEIVRSGQVSIRLCLIGLFEKKLRKYAMK